MHDGMPYGRNQGQGHSREVDRQSPTGLIFYLFTLLNYSFIYLFTNRRLHNGTTKYNRYEYTNTTDCLQFLESRLRMGSATGGGTMPPLLGPAGYRGYRGRSNENDICFYSRVIFIQYCTSDCISTPLTSRHLPS